MSGDQKLDGKALAKFNTLRECEEGMTETERELYWVAPDGRVYDSMTFSDGACWLTMEASTLHALYDLQTSIEFFGSEKLEGNFLTLVKDAEILKKQFETVMKSIKYKPLIQEKF